MGEIFSLRHASEIRRFLRHAASAAITPDKYALRLEIISAALADYFAIARHDDDTLPMITPILIEDIVELRFDTPLIFYAALIAIVTAFEIYAAMFLPLMACLRLFDIDYWLLLSFRCHIFVFLYALPLSLAAIIDYLRHFLAD